MPIAESGGFTFQIVCTVKKSCLQNLSCFCPFRNSSEGVIFVGCFLLDINWIKDCRKNVLFFVIPVNFYYLTYFFRKISNSFDIPF
jgi:hypothetical protein